MVICVSDTQTHRFTYDDARTRRTFPFDFVYRIIIINWFLSVRWVELSRERLLIAWKQSSGFGFIFIHTLTTCVVQNAFTNILLINHFVRFHFWASGGGGGGRVFIIIISVNVSRTVVWSDDDDDDVTNYDYFSFFSSYSLSAHSLTHSHKHTHTMSVRSENNEPRSTKHHKS